MNVPTIEEVQIGRDVHVGAELRMGGRKVADRNHASLEDVAIMCYGGSLGARLACYLHPPFADHLGRATSHWAERGVVSQSPLWIDTCPSYCDWSAGP